MIFQRKENRGIVSFSNFLIFFLLLLAVALKASWLFDIDKMIQSITTIQPDSVTAKIFQAVTFIGSPAVVLIISAVMIVYFIFQKQRITSLWIAFTILGGDAVAFAFKQLVKRPRPSGIIGAAHGYSFPSGHVFGTTILVLFVIVICVPRVAEASSRFWIQVFMWVWLFIIVISRVYLRSHYPSDVLGSLLLAASWWQLSTMLYFRFYAAANKVLKDQEIPEESHE